MPKIKRIIGRPWGRKHKGGWIIQPDHLIQTLKLAPVAEFGSLRFGANQLADLVRLMRFPDQELFIKASDRLEVENISRFMSKRSGHLRTEFRKPRLSHSFRVDNLAWLPKSTKPVNTVIIKPRKYA